MKKLEFDYFMLCLEVTPPEGGTSGSLGNGTEGPAEDDKKPILGDDEGDIIEPDPLWPPVGF